MLSQAPQRVYTVRKYSFSAGRCAMPMNRIQFQPGLSMPEFLQRYGTEPSCEAALEQARWPAGFRCPRCDGVTYSRVRGRPYALFQCQACRHQTSLIAGTVMQGTKLPLTTRSEEAKYELQSLMRRSYAVFRLKKKKQ